MRPEKKNQDVMLEKVELKHLADPRLSCHAKFSQTKHAKIKTMESRQFFVDGVDPISR